MSHILPAVQRSTLLLALTLFAIGANASTLPGFRIELLGKANGFVTSVALDSTDRVYYTVTNGKVFRLEYGTSVPVAVVPTAAEGNAALLGMTFRNDEEIVLHYVASDLTGEVLASIHPGNGAEIRSISIPCNRGAPCSTEHHGGNPIALKDGTVFVGFGDFGGSQYAQDPTAAGGKIYRMKPDGTVEPYARGFRNPFDLAWDSASGKLIVSDNGVSGDDEINLIGEGDNAGWALTMGDDPPVPGTVPPIYVFPATVAPTGIHLIRSSASLRSGGLLVGSFVTRALYYFPDLSVRPVPHPIEIIRSEIGPVIDMTENSRGEIIVASGTGIYRLIPPVPGDANGDGKVNDLDLSAISREILDGDGLETMNAQNGTYRGSWGADANVDGVIDARDLVALAKMRIPRTRPARP